MLVTVRGRERRPAGHGRGYHPREPDCLPADAVGAPDHSRTELRAEVDRLARQFKVSTLVILRRIHDLGGISKDQLWQEYKIELERLQAIPKGSGGNFDLTQAARVLVGLSNCKKSANPNPWRAWIRREVARDRAEGHHSGGRRARCTRGVRGVLAFCRTSKTAFG